MSFSYICDKQLRILPIPQKQKLVYIPQKHCAVHHQAHHLWSLLPTMTMLPTVRVTICISKSAKQREGKERADPQAMQGYDGGGAWISSRESSELNYSKG